jgi:hypothetical protein
LFLVSDNLFRFSTAGPEIAGQGASSDMDLEQHKGGRTDSNKSKKVLHDRANLAREGMNYKN